MGGDKKISTIPESLPGAKKEVLQQPIQATGVIDLVRVRVKYI